MSACARPACPLYRMLGNDDPASLAAELDVAAWGAQAEGGRRSATTATRCQLRMVEHHAVAQLPREERRGAGRALHELGAGRRIRSTRSSTPRAAVRERAGRGADARCGSARGPEHRAGEVRAGGQQAVRDIERETQPMLALHGHIHESAGIRRLGRTIAINPGSDYATGALNGALMTLPEGKVAAHQLVRGCADGASRWWPSTSGPPARARCLRDRLASSLHEVRPQHIPPPPRARAGRSRTPALAARGAIGELADLMRRLAEPGIGGSPSASPGSAQRSAGRRSRRTEAPG